MNYDEQARLEFIDGQNDAIALLSPQSDSPYYLQGWQDTKHRLRGSSSNCTDNYSKAETLVM